MINAYKTVHGAIIYALADHAFSVACNSPGRTSMGVSTTIQFMKSALPGDKLIAKATELNKSFRQGFYRVELFHNEKLIASMGAVSHRTSKYFIEL
ncbi:hotdog domain-containing protein [Cytobacillus sp. FSL R5-0569]|uniref:hotdog domain-containing protein n=1 Tax=Cytobacillus sp. FSL R5-0569 TaxID=2921649 RepID=UPI0030FB5F02